jgi:glycosyltransferase involved in cell wall biosynthesis
MAMSRGKAAPSSQTGGGVSADDPVPPERRPTIAVVITNYNYSAYVVAAVESALSQSRPLQQVIVVDDGSTDGSPDLLRERFGTDPRVTLLIGDNAGQVLAMKRGLDAVTTDVVCFLDADDLWREGYAARIAALYAARPDIGFVFSDMKMFGTSDRVLSFADGELDLGFTAAITYFSRKWYGTPTSALSLRTPLARDCLDLPEDILEDWRMGADNPLVYGASLLLARKYYLPTGDVRYRMHDVNGWGLKPSESAKFLTWARTEKLVAHYASRSGLSPQTWRLLRTEIRTRPVVTASETRRYAIAALRLNQPFLVRLQLALDIVSWAVRKRIAASRGRRPAP